MSRAPEAGQQGGQHATETTPLSYEELDERPIRVLAIVNTLLRRRWIIVGVAGTITMGAVVMSLLATPVFTATAKFLPSQSQAMSSRMGSIIERGANVGSRDDPSTDYYIALLESHSFLRSVVVRQYRDADGEMKPLSAIYKSKGSTGEEQERRAVERLEKSVAVSAPRATNPQLPRVITIECQAGTATLASDICAAILDEIKVHNAEVRGAKARQNREFVQSQLDTSKKELDAATADFATFTARNRKIVSPALEAERDRLERLVRVKEDVYNTLSRQLVLARIEEQETRPSLEMIQNPEPPLQRSAPARTRTVMLAGVIGLVLGCVLAILWDRIRRMDPTDPDTAELKDNIADIKQDAFRIALLRRKSAATG